MKVLVASQDPGGTNAIAPVVAALIARGDEVSESIENPDIVLVGTSGGMSRDKEAIKEWKGRVPTIAVLDFWSRYWQRFSTPGVKDFAYMPDIVCVMDDIAKDEMVAEGFNPEQIRVTGNPHFDNFADGISKAGEDPKRVLFISQPIRADSTLPGFPPAQSNEFDMLEALIVALPEGYSISIRLHPRDDIHKYDKYLNNTVTIAQDKTIEEAISKSALIVGGITPVLMQAALAGKKVLSFEPSLVGPDPMVSNRVGVTPLIDSPEALKDALAQYAAVQWPFTLRPLRDVWPTGATQRVVAEIDKLIKVV